MTLQDKIVRFVETWGPDKGKHGTLRDVFIESLRKLLNEYAEAAIKHGNIPEVGKPHRTR